MPSTEQGGRAHSNGRRPGKMLVSPVLGASRPGRVLAEIEDVLYVFTRTAAVGADPRIFASWARPTIIRSEKIHCRTRTLVATVNFGAIDQAVRELPILALAVVTNGVAVNLDRVDEVDEGGHYRRLGFHIVDGRGQHVETEWIRMSRKRGSDVLDAYGSWTRRSDQGGL